MAEHYKYENHLSYVTSHEGQRNLLRAYDRVHKMISTSGAVRMLEAIEGFSGDNWEAMAIIDHLVKLEVIRDVSSAGCVGQNRVFVRGRYMPQRLKLKEKP